MHHEQLSEMVDEKANMLLTMASVLLTISVTQIGTPELKWAIIVLLPFSFSTVILSAYATMPGGWAKNPQPGEPGFNILFFGHFKDMPYKDYERAMEKVMNDPSKTYEAQIREVYTLGVFLAKRKFRSVRLAYFCFIVGLIAAAGVAVFTAVTSSA
jgi:hypothetical protein